MEETSNLQLNDSTLNGNNKAHNENCASNGASRELTFRERAEPLIKLGWRITPLRPCSKKAAFNDWTKLQPTRADYESWFKNKDYTYHNAGIVLGLASGVFVLDKDDIATADEYLKDHPLPATPTVLSGRPGGSHSYFRNYGCRVKKCAAEKFHGMDILGDGQQSVGPNSIHPDYGNPDKPDYHKYYRWAPGLGPDLPVADPTLWVAKMAFDPADPKYPLVLKLAEAIGKLAPLKEGRNNILYKGALGAAKLAKGEDDRKLISANLTRVARATGLEPSAIAATIRSAFNMAAEQAANPIPSPWELRPRDGIYRTTKVQAESDADPSIIHEWIMGHLEIVAISRDQASERRGRWARVIDADGVEHEFAIPSDMLVSGDTSALRRLLGHYSLDLSPKKRHREAVLEYIHAVKPTERRRIVDRIGWQKDMKRFVLPDKVYGAADGEGLVYQPDETQRFRYSPQGTLAEWQQHVAPLCSGNSSLLLSLAIGISAGMMPVAKVVENTIFNFWGTGSAGKSTALRVGFSLWGNSDALNTWRTTDNGLEGVAESYSDTLMPLDEMKLIDARAVGSAVFMYASGLGKSRMKQDTTMRLVKTWRGFSLSSGHTTLEDKANENGERANGNKERGGEEVRCIDLAHDAGAGMGMFEDLHGAADGADFAGGLKEATGLYYGTPIRALLEQVTAPGALEQVRATLKDYMKQFIDSLALPAGTDTHGEVRRVANKFAFVAACGKLATDYNIFPFGPDEIFDGVRKQFKNWLAARGGYGAAEDEGTLSQVRLNLEKYGEARFDEVNPAGRYPRVANPRWGWRKWVDDKGYEFYVLPEVWRTEFCKGGNSKRTVELMVEAGYMEAPENEAGLAKRHRPIRKEKQERTYRILAGFIVMPRVIADDAQGMFDRERKINDHDEF